MLDGADDSVGGFAGSCCWWWCICVCGVGVPLKEAMMVVIVQKSCKGFKQIQNHGITSYFS